jgi:hypothetical protein
MWSWNPVDWVFVPVKCALEWAFVPPSGTFTDAMDTLLDLFVGPGEYGAMLNLGFEAPASGCGGFPIDFALVENVSVHQHLGAACEGQAATAAYLVRSLAAACVWLVAGWRSVTIILRAFGIGVGVQPVEGVGADGSQQTALF